MWALLHSCGNQKMCYSSTKPLNFSGRWRLVDFMFWLTQTRLWKKVRNFKPQFLTKDNHLMLQVLCYYCHNISEEKKISGLTFPIAAVDWHLRGGLSVFHGASCGDDKRTYRNFNSRLSCPVTSNSFISLWFETWHSVIFRKLGEGVKIYVHVHPLQLRGYKDHFTEIKRWWYSDH